MLALKPCGLDRLSEGLHAERPALGLVQKIWNQGSTWIGINMVSCFRSRIYKKTIECGTALPTVELDGRRVQRVLWDGNKDSVVPVPNNGIEAHAHCHAGTIGEEDVLMRRKVEEEECYEN